MIGATLAHWTMSYFAAALVSLIAAQGLMVAGFGFPALPLAAPETLLLVHLIAIGWLSLLMCGALFQFVPVLVARPLHNDFAPLPALILLLAGLGALLLGFCQLAGYLDPGPPLLPAGAVLLAGGFAVVFWNLARTLWAGRPLPLPARFVVVGLLSVVATVLFGVVFALVLGGISTSWPLVELTRAGVPLHAIAGLGGWLTFTAMGVSYRLMAMFMLAPEPNGATSRGVLYGGTLALTALVVAGTLAICANKDPAWTFVAGGVLALVTLALYARDVRQLYRARKRRVIELNSRMAAVAVFDLVAGVSLAIASLAAGTFEAHIGAFVFLFAFGWLSGLGLAKLYKIVAFLTWLECYGPILGKVPTPRVQDLVVERRAAPWFAVYHIAVWISAACLAANFATPFRAGAAVMLIATIAIIAQLVRIRRLADVSAADGLQDLIGRPALLFLAARHR